jgi:uncharacterized protein YciW
MLLHLPIAIMMTFSPIAVSDSVPQFNIVSECRFEGDFDHCSQDETAAFSELRTEWAQFNGTDHKTCMATTMTGGFASYVELLTCLEMARDAGRENSSPNDSHMRSEIRPMQPGRPGVTVGKAH